MADQILDTAVEWLTYFYNNFSRNITHMFDGMQAKNWLRIVAVVGAYIIFRPRLLDLAARFQTRQYEKDFDPAPRTAISPNSLRQGIQVEKDKDGAEATGADTGKQARKRQRQLEKRSLQASERTRIEEDEELLDEDERWLEEMISMPKEALPNI